MSAVLAAAALLAGATSAQAQVNRPAQGPWGGKTKGVGKYAEVNGIKLYYEIQGTGKPLILLHGGLGAIEMFGPNLPAMAKVRQVDRALSVELMADDTAALIKYLKLERPDIMGYSLGGGVALQTAIQHPEVVGKLVVVSTPIRRNAFYPEILAQQAQVTAAAAEGMKQTPMYELYASLAPRPEDFPKLLGKIGEAMKKDFDFSKEVAGVQATTLVVAGDADISRPPLR